MQRYDEPQAHALGEPHTVRPLNVREHLVLSSLWFALNFQSAALLPIVVPTQILLFITSSEVGGAEQATALAWFSALGAIIALFIPPIIGALSDRTPRPFGRRRPYIAAGAVVLLLGAVEMAIAPTLQAFVAGFLLFQVGNNVGTAAYQGLLPDRVPEEQRGQASGYLGLMTILGNVGSLALAALLFSQVQSGPGLHSTVTQGAYAFYAVTGVALLVIVLVTVLGVPEDVNPALAAPSRGESHGLLRMWIDPWRHHNFIWVFLTRGFVMLGLTLFLTFIEYYFATVAHVTDFVGETAAVAVLALVGAILSTLLAGILSDRIGRVLLVGLSSGCMALAALAFVLFPGAIPLWPLGILFGFGYGAYTSVDWALAIDALPSLSAAGKDLGLWTVASTLPAIIAPLLGGAVIGLTSVFGQTALGYRIVFALAALVLLLGAVFVRLIQTEQDARSEARRSAAGGRVNRWWRLALRTRAGRARGFLRFWPIWERVMQIAQPLTRVPGSPNQLFAIHVSRYRGRPIVLPDGTQVANGDRVAEIHFQNRALLDAASRYTNWRVLRMLQQDLRALAAWSRQPDFPANVRTLYGVTLLGRAAPRLGFTVRERPRTIHARLDRFFLMGLLVLYSSRGLERLANGTTYGTYPAEAWMSLDELRRRYGTTGTARQDVPHEGADAPQAPGEPEAPEAPEEPEAR